MRGSAKTGSCESRSSSCSVAERAEADSPAPAEVCSATLAEPLKQGAILLTGANGFIGSHLATALLDRGAVVRATARNPQLAKMRGDARLQWMQAELGKPIEPRCFSGVEVVVHVAWATNVRDPQGAARLNFEGAKALFAAARQADVPRMVFISSMSAHAGAQSSYGRSKLQVEELLHPQNDLVIRPGFVLGDGGVFARLADSIARMPVLPLFFGGAQPIQTICIDDLCTGAVRAIERGLHGRLVLASPEILSIRAFYAAIAAQRGAPHRAMCRVPGAPAWWALRLCERLGLPVPLTSENLLGLKALASYDTTFDLQRVELTPKSCYEALRGMAPPPRGHR